ncbi:hypothetical protein M9C84_04920 [SAR86 cluster bacterium]|nr:hypothetical protein M9C84_04920 [SAR86 cluster bacterium]|tara:strand:+ start:349 stop:624 length:276 start_codon:yes stop_codon:yes gene_type:complete
MEKSVNQVKAYNVFLIKYERNRELIKQLNHRITLKLANKVTVKKEKIKMENLLKFEEFIIEEFLSGMNIFKKEMSEKKFNALKERLIKAIR